MKSSDKWRVASAEHGSGRDGQTHLVGIQPVTVFGRDPDRSEQVGGPTSPCVRLPHVGYRRFRGREEEFKIQNSRFKIALWPLAMQIPRILSQRTADAKAEAINYKYVKNKIRNTAICMKTINGTKCPIKVREFGTPGCARFRNIVSGAGRWPRTASPKTRR